MKQLDSIIPHDDPQCPRCGYDQRGVLQTWKESCPLEGVCTECGLRFSWAEVILPDKFAPRWLVEYRPGRLGALRAFPITVWRSLRPFKFWSRIDLAHPVRPGRLVIYVLLLLLIPAAAYVIEQATVAMAVHWTLAQQPGITVNHSPITAIVEAVFQPAARTSSGTITIGGTLDSYPAPAELHQNFLNWSGRFGFRPPGVWYLTSRSAMLLRPHLFALWIYAFIPLGFVLLPISRRKARVRPLHFVRISMYGFVISVLMIALFILSIAVTCLRGGSEGWIELAIIANQYLTLPLFIVWWIAATGRYLVMPHAIGIVLALASIAVLLVMLVLSLFWFKQAIDACDMVEPTFILDRLAEAIHDL